MMHPQVIKCRNGMESRQGFVMTASIMMMLVAMMVAGSFALVAQRSQPAVLRWERYDHTLLAAQTALERVKLNLYYDFRAYHNTSRSWQDLQWVIHNAASYSVSDALHEILDGDGPVVYEDAEMDVVVITGSLDTSEPEAPFVPVTFRVTATYHGISRRIEEVVRYGINRSSVFDNAYFINNFGWFHGVNIVVNGDVRSNFDVDLRSRDLVLNGYSRAAGSNSIRQPYQTWNWTTYSGHALSSWFRPTEHVDGNKRNNDSYFEFGYRDSGTINRAREVEMPFIGNLSDYVYYAETEGGSISIGEEVVVEAWFNEVGPSGDADAPDHGSVILIGTEENPIVLDGPVVVQNDVIIKGYFTGQGTIYAGRNIHIIGDVRALDPPQWQHPDSAENFEDTTLPENLERDFIGLCARGAVVVGDYRHRDFRGFLADYVRPPFTSEYEVAATDADIGYVTRTDGDTHFFNGDYAAFFGERCGGPGNPPVPRRYFESSLSDAVFGAQGPDLAVNRIDAVIYNNHLTMGRLSRNAMINGAIVGRDEAILVDGRTYFNWDPRLAMTDRFRPFLPRELRPASTIRWREMEVSP